MGLDIYLYRVKKPDGIKENDIISNDNSLILLDINDKDGKKIKYCKTILNNSVKVKCRRKNTDYDKIYLDYAKNPNLENKKINITSISVKGYTFDIDGEIVNIDGSIIRNNYCYETIEDFYAVDLREVEYQRGLGDEGREFLPKNCEYCDDIKRVNKLVKNGLKHSFKDMWIPEKTVLLAWW